MLKELRLMVVSVPRVLPIVLAVPVLCVFGEVEVAGEDGGLFVVGWDLVRKLGDGVLSFWRSLPDWR